jgi:hypothetical protein
MTDNAKIVIKLEPAEYAALCRTIPGAVINVASTTTDLQAGFQLGVQAVLQALREGFVYAR